MSQGSDAARLKDAGNDAQGDVPGAVRWKIFFYLGMLILLLTLGSPSGGIIGVPIFVLLKNKLNLPAHEVAEFRFLAAVPLYLSFVFGFFRDTWNPLGIKDRGFIIVFGTINAAVYLVAGLLPVTYASVLVELMLLKICFLFVSSAQNGLTSLVAQQRLMPGQISAVWNVFLSICGIVALNIAGPIINLTGEMTPTAGFHLIFFIGSAIMASVAIYGFWRPKPVFDNLQVGENVNSPIFAGLKRLATHRSIYPALLIWLIWNFQPGADTALLYHLQNNFPMDRSLWVEWNTLNTASFIPTFVLFGFICRKVPLRTLLFWSTAAAIPQWVPLLFIHSATGALIAAVPIGLMGGAATAGYLALIIRSAPPSLQGSTLMMAGALNVLAARIGDVFGTGLYDHYGGFSACVVAMMALYALILPILLTIPRHVIATTDGQADAGGASVSGRS